MAGVKMSTRENKKKRNFPPVAAAAAARAEPAELFAFDSHASLHEQGLNPGAASSQLKVDGAASQNHPLAPEAAPLEQGDGWQRELLRREEEGEGEGGGEKEQTRGGQGGAAPD